MLWRLALALLVPLAAGPALAAPAKVRTGAHEGFVRLVVDLDAPAPWRVGRTEGGYELRIEGVSTDFDLAATFRAIGRDRLADVALSPGGGGLILTLGCACHVAPFEPGPGRIVIDIKDGPAPENWPYEAPLPPGPAPEPATDPDPAQATETPFAAATLAGEAPMAEDEALWDEAALEEWEDAPEAGPQAPAPIPPGPAEATVPTAPSPLDKAWALRALGLDGGPAPAAENREPMRVGGRDGFDVPTASDARKRAPDRPRSITPPPDNPPTAQADLLPRHALLDPALVPLRDSILREISRGASQGLIGVSIPKQPEEAVETATGNATLQTRVGFEDLGAALQVTVTQGEPAPPDLGREGAECPTDVQLDLAAWGDDRPVWEQLSAARAGLVGEFDRPDSEALRRAIRFHLFIGFGAETRRLIAAFDVQDRDRALWESLSHVLDGDADPTQVLNAMGACESAAALWALLAVETPQGHGPWNLPAIQRAFSALPGHLRAQLGPPLVHRLDQMGEGDAVEVIRNAIRRSGPEEDRGLQLMEAGLAAGDGEHAEAETILRNLREDPGPGTAEALALWIEGQAARALPVPPETVAEAAALAAEYEGSETGPHLMRALSLAQALSGDFDAAFAGARDPGLRAELWRLLSVLCTDEALLAHAATAPQGPAPGEGAAVAATIAERLLTLGLPDPAHAWLNLAPAADPLLVARVSLARRDGVSALAALEGQTGEGVDALRLQALEMLGQEQDLASALTAAGDTAAAARALGRARDWTALQAASDPLWQSAAAALEPHGGGQPAPGTLAAGNAAVDRAVTTRAAIDALLAGVPPIADEAPPPATN